MNIQCGNEMKKIYIVGCCFTIYFSLYGCLLPSMWKNPGYRVSLTVHQCQLVNIGIIENYLKENGYHLDAKSYFNSRHVIQYSKTVIKNTQIKDPKVTVIMLQDNIDNDRCDSLRIAIQNWYHGNNLRIREEIDKTGNALEAKLSLIVGKKNVELIRKTTGPPF